MIQIEGFKKVYRKTVVTHPDRTLSHKITLLIGGNGSGKTTLLKAMAGLIVYEGRLNVPDSVLYVQETAHYPEDMTIDTYLKGLCRLEKRPFFGLDALLEAFELRHRRHDAFKSLSKGMKQKVNLMSAMLAKRALTCYDEPLNGLDALSRKRFVEHLGHQAGMIICATHLVDDFADLDAERIRL
ncbi:MAG: ATP-binding cassette domain-containing protein [Acholeplasmatales bacterium]|nr:MAG: ATP-binding cassette domain-containing protein [Acholeplasmatales bacterium]